MKKGSRILLRVRSTAAGTGPADLQHREVHVDIQCLGPRATSASAEQWFRLAGSEADHVLRVPTTSDHHHRLFPYLMLHHAGAKVENMHMLGGEPGTVDAYLQQSGGHDDL